MSNIDFEITEKEIELSKRLFNGKIIKIIIANGSFKKTPDWDTLFTQCEVLWYPENEYTFKQLSEYIEKLSNSTTFGKSYGINNQPNPIVIITNSLQIVSSVPKCLCRLSERSETNELILKELEFETFVGNLLEFLVDFGGKTVSSNSVKFVKMIDERCKTNKWETDENEKMEIMNDIELIGDTVICFHLYSNIGIKRKFEDFNRYK